MTAGILPLPPTATRARLADIVAADGQVAHENGLGERTGHAEIGAKVLFLVAAITSHAGLDPGTILAGVIGAGDTGDRLRNNRLCRTGYRQQLRVGAIGPAHHLAFCTDKIGAIVPIAENLVRFEL